MITNTGKNIIAKYLIGQTPAYASYLAIGCGPAPLPTSYSFQSSDTTAYTNKTSLDFEMLRVPIISKGYISENGISKVVFTAELPTADRYNITEVGIYPALNNPVANQDSYNVLSFTNEENWSVISSGSSNLIPIQTNISPISISTTLGDGGKYFQTNVDNIGLVSETRTSRLEQLRISANAFYVRGDFSTDTTDGPYLLMNNASIDFSQNNPTDELRLAFSIISDTDGNASVPADITITVKFVTSNGDTATMVNNSSTLISAFTSGNRYVVSKVPLNNLTLTSGFAWSNVSQVKVYVSASASSSYWIGLDGIRFENLTDLSPIYGLAGYTILKNSAYRISTNPTGQEYAAPVLKSLNTSGLVEFKFALDVI